MTAALIPGEWEKNRLGWLGLCWYPEFGAQSLNKLRGEFSDRGLDAFNASLQDLIRCKINGNAAHNFIAWRKCINLEALARRCDADAIRLVLREDEEYPPRLQTMNDPPAGLFVRGALPKTECLAVVGTRSITSYGHTVTRQLVGEMAGLGVTIISGLAMGVDGTAHAAALDAQGATAAILPGGCNNNAIYPRFNLKLAERILTQGGALISEFPPGTFSLKHHFPLRNRIIAGMCRATLVIEGAEGSGSLITAKLALDYNREVLAVPGPITSPQSQGTNQLIKLGAIPCTEANDIKHALKMDALIPPPFTLELSADELVALELLNRPLHSDELIRSLEMPASAVIALLTSMELRGLIEQQNGHYSACVEIPRKADDD